MKLLSADLTSNPFCQWLMCPVANDFAHLLHNTGLAFNPAKTKKILHSTPLVVVTAGVYSYLYHRPLPMTFHPMKPAGTIFA